MAEFEEPKPVEAPEPERPKTLEEAKSPLVKKNLSKPDILQMTRASFRESMGVSGASASKFAHLGGMREVYDDNPNYIDWFDNSKFRFKPLGESEVDSQIFYTFEQHDQEWEENLITARILVAKGFGDVYLLPRQKGKGLQISSPDALVNGLLFDFKRIGDVGEKTIIEHLKKIKKQAGNAIFYFSSENTKGLIKLIRKNATEEGVNVVKGIDNRGRVVRIKD